MFFNSRGAQTFVRLCTATYSSALAEGYQQAHHARVEFPGNSAATPVNDGPAGVGLHGFSSFSLVNDVLEAFNRTGITASRPGRVNNFNRVALSSSRSVKSRRDDGEHLIVSGVAVFLD